MNKNTLRRLTSHRKAAKGNKFKPGVVSISKEKNVQMVVLHNKNEAGEIESITHFKPLNPDSQVKRSAYRIKPVTL
jgi:hypothetical protein